MEYDKDKIDEMALALLYPTSFTDEHGTRTWKGMAHRSTTSLVWPASSSPLVNCLRMAWQKDLGLGLVNTVSTFIGHTFGSLGVMSEVRTPRLSQE